MGMRETLERVLGRGGSGDLVRRLGDQGIVLADEETMSRAIHACYCGPSPDHIDPNEKDRDQARVMLAAMARYSTHH